MIIYIYDDKIFTDEFYLDEYIADKLSEQGWNNCDVPSELIVDEYVNVEERRVTDEQLAELLASGLEFER